MKTGVKAIEIANRDFPILNSELTLEEFLTKLNKKQENYAVIKSGKLHSILNYQELLKAFITKKKKIIIENIKKDNFVFVPGDKDVSEILNLVKKGKFVVIKEPLAIITKKEILDFNEELFRQLE
ncbi:MAG: hypothetical protein NT076_00090 [Candidatus Pacearchaeota archaeon]|nr:hypothetical protein [Candidatus Pacearchaeota archaeon]